MANSVVSALRDTIQAFNLPDENLARRVLRGDDVVDALYHQIVQDTLTSMQADPHKANRDLSNIMIAKNLERIADHCTNIAEDVIYVHSGRIIRHLHTV
jgi:phosphate transport system protein